MTGSVYIAVHVRDFDVSISRISELIGVSPTKSWLSGDIAKRTRLKRKNNSWVFERKFDGGVDIGREAFAVLEYLFDGLVFCRDSVNCNILFKIAIYVEIEERLPFCLSVSTIEKLSRLESAIDIDLYQI
ncbi:MAG TPA: DUF4279 domain-containing protein [Aliidongia sp.]|uniref:DUF4279 domain-containing protein n=1 Tax=Aliidongia sp. TaxID=1914230 RepID=UPI002DDD0F8E|nr:DUF4279 domain-containing protein [Aliidongia sp.]HEV2674297.1 DUF4279 domain-containing protein [Aliidongia sp.]